MAEVSLIPESELLGKTVREMGFRTRYGLNVVGLKRDGVAMEGPLWMSLSCWAIFFSWWVTGSLSASSAKRPRFCGTQHAR